VKKILAFILLLAHVNFAMFIAQIDESDSFDKAGQQKEDINSLVQYVDLVILKHNRHTKDTDDDNARYFHAAKFDDYSFSQTGVIKREYFIVGKTKFPPSIEKKLTSVCLEIQGPPPKV
jgi:hypothetical protein